MAALTHVWNYIHKEEENALKTLMDVICINFGITQSEKQDVIAKLCNQVYAVYHDLYKEVPMLEIFGAVENRRLKIAPSTVEVFLQEQCDNNVSVYFARRRRKRTEISDHLAKLEHILKNQDTDNALSRAQKKYKDLIEGFWWEYIHTLLVRTFMHPLEVNNDQLNRV